MKQVNQFSKWASLFLITGLVTFPSCKKDNSVPQTPDTPAIAATMDVTQSNAIAEEQYDDVFNITMGVQSSDVGEDIGIGAGINVIYTNTPTAGGTSTPDSASSRCFIVTVSPRGLHVFPKTVTVDFGNGCLGRDGRLRSGKIVTVYTGPMFIPGNSATTTFVDYSVDSFKIEGTHIVANTGSAGKVQWAVKVADGKITNTNSGNWRTWNSTRTYTLVEGSATAVNPLNVMLQITGSASGSNSNGNGWTAEIVSPLIKKFTCPWKVKGTVNITRNSVMAILDYGDGTCDNKATVSINGVTHIITLH
jgi:hypothetical protein